jgi:predicted nucleotidyltransferase
MIDSKLILSDLKYSLQRQYSDAVKNVILFGSHSKDTATEYSDYDILNTFPEFVSQKLSKDTYKLDHYAVDYCYDPNTTVELTRYWIQLFTHNRSGVWKGILRLSLSTPTEDNASLHFLNNLVL